MAYVMGGGFRAQANPDDPCRLNHRGSGRFTSTEVTGSSEWPHGTYTQENQMWKADRGLFAKDSTL